MIKWFVILLLAIPRIIYSTVKLFFMNKNKEKYPIEKRYKVVRNTVLWICKLTRAKLNIINEHLIKNKPDHGRVFVANHVNVFEAAAYICLSEKPIYFISKKENSNVPFLKQHALGVDALMIDREDVRQSLRVCKKAGEIVRSGYDVVIFAEGTRSKDGNVAPFKAALSTLVHYSQSEVILTCFHDSHKPLKWRWISYPKEVVNIKFFEPLSYQFYLENKKQFPVITRDMIQSQLEEFRKGQ